MAFEVPSYPELGHVYPGDYDPVIPYDAHIPSRPLPEGEFVVDIRDCGALGDGKTLCTKAFRQAAETLRARGGGTLLVRRSGLPETRRIFCSRGSPCIQGNPFPARLCT